MDQKVEQKRKEKIWQEEKAMGDFKGKIISLNKYPSIEP